MAVSLRSVEFRAKRLTMRSEKPFDTIMKRLYAEIGSPDEAGAAKRLIEDVRDVASFTDAIRKATGTPPEQDVKDRFMIFQVRCRAFNVPRYQSLSISIAR
jgi:hypothetical protein